MKNAQKRIIIHTGPGKTGSSAIQAWLCKHDDFLREKGVYYPKHGLAQNGISSGHIRDLLSLKDNKWVVDQAKVDKLIAQFHARKESILLLSSEFFFHQISALHKAIPSAEFVAYVRNPVELLESNYNQGVKRHTSINKFKPPVSLDNYFWKYLSTLFNALPNELIFLRAYHSDLFVNGNIVADLLDMLDLELSQDQLLKREKINPSYTFPALEFKRLLNHFPLGSLEASLDVALQDCDIGLKHYSLFSSDEYQALTKENIKLMQAFIEKYQQAQLQPLLEKLGCSVQKTKVCHQDIKLVQLEEVGSFIKNKYQSLYSSLLSLVYLHPNLSIDNPIVYRVFGMEPPADFSKNKCVQALFSTAENFTIHQNNKPKVLNDLSDYFLSIDELQKALDFAQVACLLSQYSQEARARLNRVQVLLNEHNSSQHKDLDYNIQIFSFKSKVRNKVKQILKLA